MMRILVTGTSGQVGFELMRACQPLGDVTGVDFPVLDLSQHDELRSYLNATPADVIVNPAAYTAVDKAESDEALAHAINGTAVEIMAEHARAKGALLIHYSTDYVFDGAKNSPYLPDDEPGPLSAYGRTKLAGERALAASGCDYLCLRTSWVYASRGRNFLKTMLKLAQEREELRVVADQIGAPTPARLLADVTAQIIGRAQRERQCRSFRSELLQVTTTGATSWYGFAAAIVEQAARRGIPIKAKTITPIRTEEYPTPARRPLNSRLDCQRIRQRYDLMLPDWVHSLGLCLDEIEGVRTS
jgi:dTDP-4-dehydrorhamnose reductase